MDSSTSKEVKVEFPGLIKVFTDGSVERIFGSPHVPPTHEDPETHVSSKDVTISTSTGLSARLYLPKLEDDHKNIRLPILVYFHGGGFCLESAFSSLDHRYMNLLASHARVLIVSVEYRLAPEHPLPIAYQDCWDALNWTASLQDPWLANHGDLNIEAESTLKSQSIKSSPNDTTCGLFIGGDSAGANIVHNIAMRASRDTIDHGVMILGAFLSHPYFLDDKDAPHLAMPYEIWELVYPDALGGPDNYMINPVVDGAPSLSGLKCCRRILVIVSEKDELRDCGVRYYDAVKKSGFEGEIELFEVKEEGHCFHAFNPNTDNAKLVFNRLSSFLQK